MLCFGGFVHICTLCPQRNCGTLSWSCPRGMLAWDYCSLICLRLPPEDRIGGVASRAGGGVPASSHSETLAFWSPTLLGSLWCWHSCWERYFVSYCNQKLQAMNQTTVGAKATDQEDPAIPKGLNSPSTANPASIVPRVTQLFPLSSSPPPAPKLLPLAGYRKLNPEAESI